MAKKNLMSKWYILNQSWEEFQSYPFVGFVMAAIKSSPESHHEILGDYVGNIPTFIDYGLDPIQIPTMDELDEIIDFDRDYDFMKSSSMKSFHDLKYYFQHYCDPKWIAESLCTVSQAAFRGMTQDYGRRDCDDVLMAMGQLFCFMKVLENCASVWKKSEGLKDNPSAANDIVAALDVLINAALSSAMSHAEWDVEKFGKVNDAIITVNILKETLMSRSGG